MSENFSLEVWALCAPNPFCTNIARKVTQKAKGKNSLGTKYLAHYMKLDPKITFDHMGKCFYRGYSRASARLCWL